MTAESVVLVLRAYLRRQGLALTDGGIPVGGVLEEHALREVVDLVVDAHKAPSPEGSGLGVPRAATKEILPETIARLVAASRQE